MTIADRFIEKAKSLLFRQERDFSLLLVPLGAKIVSVPSERDGPVFRDKAKPTPAGQIRIDTLKRKHLCFKIESVVSA